MKQHEQGGCHFLVTIGNVRNRDLLCDVDPLRAQMSAFIQEMDLHVMAECAHQFTPHGATILYLLSESHFSAHTFWESRKIILDLFCCAPHIDIDKAKHLFQKLFMGDVTQFQVIRRD